MVAEIVIGILVVVVVCLVVALKRKSVTAAPAASTGLVQVSTVATTAELEAEALPTAIVVGESVDKPLLTIEASRDIQAFHRGTPVPVDGAVVSRVSALLQAAPSLLVAGQAQGKQLMDVVINGSLVRAADGNGLRAIAMGPTGIMDACTPV